MNSISDKKIERLSFAIKIFRVMRLCLLFIALSLTQVFASVSYSQSTSLTLKMKNVSIEDVLNKIEEKTEFRFLYNKDVVNVGQRVNVSVNESSISDILNNILKNTDIHYTISDRQIVLSKSGLFALVSNERIVTGIVTDENGEPIIGANIIVKNDPTLGGITDVNGKFSITVPEKATLVISYIGYESKEIAVTNQSAIQVVLKESHSQLDEVIVVGYGSTSTRKTVSSVTSVKTDKIDELPYTSTSAALQGRAAGVIVQQTGGEPGGTVPTISIRGGGTPLYIIDGIIREPLDFNALTSSDIESISVLKDASATAVYGAQAGNGIVLVTTKRGNSEKINIDYTAGFDWSRPTIIPDRVNAVEYVTAANKAAEYDGRGAYAMYSEDVVNKVLNHSDPANYPDNDWLKMAINNFAPQMRHNLSMSGKSKNGVKYYTSLGYLNQESLFKQSHNNTFKRYNIRSNVSSSFDNIGLEVGLNLDAILEKRNPNPYGQSQIWRNLLAYNKPIDVAYNPDGTYSAFSVHPLAWLDKESGYDRVSDNILNTQLYATWTLPWDKGLKFKILANSRYSNYNEKYFKSSAPQYSPSGVLKEAAPSEMSLTNSWWRNNTLEASVEYSRAFDRHFLEVQGVYSYYNTTNEEFSASRNGFISNDFDQLFAGDASTQQNTGTAQEGARIGYVGRLRYNYADKYLLEGNFRYDGSDNFARDQRWGFFPSGAVAWVVSEEGFMKTLKDKQIIDFFKIRASYGQVGLETGVARFGYIPTYSYNSQSAVVGGEFVPGFTEGNLVSNALSWYTKDVFDIDFDMAFLNNHLNFTFDYYYYKTKGYLISPQNRYTTTLGKDLPQVKSNSIHRRAGYEAMVRYKNKVGHLNYDLGFNFTTYDELWEVNESESEATLKNPKKRSTHQKNYYGNAYQSSGIYQSAADVLDNPRFLSATELKPGDLAYIDVNGDGKIDSEDQVRIGKPFFPSFNYGFDFNLDYKGFFLYGLFQGTGPRYVELSGLMKGGNTMEMNYKYQLDFWTPENADAAYPRASSYQNINSSNNTQSSDFWIKNASYFRLKSLQFGYDFKNILLRNVNAISKLKLSVMGTNLFTISGVKDYFDPEVVDGSGQGYPVQQTFSVALNVGF